MPQLIWDQIDDRVYETGLDKGVLFLSDGSAVPWNGLTGIAEKADVEKVPVYFDGMKVNELLNLGNFSATMTAITYPDEFVEVEGMGQLRNGVFLGEQTPQMFSLAYRTKVGNAAEGGEAGYKIHLIYNIFATVSDRSYVTTSESPGLVEFSWEISAIPEEIVGFRPTAHIVLDSRTLDPWLLENIEELLYGGVYPEPNLLPMPELLSYIKNWYRYKITDNGDGTYTVLSGRDGQIIILSGLDTGAFELLGIDVEYINESTFIIRDTYDIADIALIKITDNGDGTWSARTPHSVLFSVTPEGQFEIYNANAVMIATDEYRLSDTIEN